MAATLSQLFVGLFNAATGGYKSEFTTAQANELANVVGIVSGQDLRSDTNYINYVLGNLGVSSTNAVYTAAFTAMQGLVTAQGRGNAVLVAASFLQEQSTVTSSPYYSVATAFVAKVAVADAYTALRPTETGVAALRAGAAGNGSNIDYTTASSEVLLGTSTSETITAYFKAAADTKNTLNATDTLTDASETDADVMNVTADANIAATDTGTVLNVETLNINVNATTTADGSSFAFAATDFTGVNTYNFNVVKAVTAINALNLDDAEDGSVINTSAAFKSVDVEVETAGDDITVNILNAGSVGAPVTFDTATTNAGDVTVNAAGYIDVDSSNTGILNVTAKQISPLTAAGATVMKLTATAGNVVVDDASDVVIADVVATGNIEFDEAAAGATLNLTAGGTVTVTGAGDLGATTLNISGVGPSSYTGDAVTTLGLSGNGGKLTMTAAEADSAGLAAVNYSGSSDVVLKITAGEVADSISYSDAGTGVFTLEVSGANTALNVSTGDLIDVLKLKTADMIDGTVLTVKSAQVVTIEADQVDGVGIANDIVVGIANNQTANSVTLVLNDDDQSSGAVDLSAIEIAQAKTVTIDASVDTTSGGTRNASTLTSFESSDVTGGVINIIGGVNGIKTATALSAGATGTINITGSGKIELQTTDVTAALLDASTATGAISSTGGLDSSLKAIYTGSGKDSLVFAGAGSVVVKTDGGDDAIALHDSDYDTLNIDIDGGDGVDTLKLTSAAGAATLLTSATSGSISLKNIEALSLVDGDTLMEIDGDLLNDKTYSVAFTTSSADQAVAVIVKATDTAIDMSKLVGSTNSDTSIVASTWTTDANAITTAIAITGITNAINSITGSSASGDVLTGGARVDTFNVATDALLFDSSNVMLDTYVGGTADNGTTTAGKDALKLSATESAFTVVAADDWSKMSGVEQITTAANTDAISLTLGATAETAGILTVNLAGDTSATGANVVSVAAYTVGATITGSEGVDTITGGAGADTITGAVGADVLAGGAGADTFTYATLVQLFETGTDNLVDASIAGGDGVDAIALTVTDAAAAYTLDATDPWADVTSVEVLKTAGKTSQIISITFGASAYTAGITTVDLSSDTTDTGANVINVSALGGGVTIVGGTGVETITGTDSDDTITGGDGNDVISAEDGEDTIKFASTAALNGTDAIVWATDDVYDFSAFFGSASGSAIDVNGVGTAGLGAFSATSADDTNIANKVAVFSTSDDADAEGVALTAAELFAEINGAANAFALSSGKSVVIAIGEDTDAANDPATVEYFANVFYIDSTLDGVAGLSVNDIVLVGTLGTTAGLAVSTAIEFVDTSFAF